jgi:hypothetical protein
MFVKKSRRKIILKRITPLVLVICLVLASAPPVRADEALSSVSIVTNVLPVASAVSIDSGAATVTLTENTTKNVIVTATVTDADGCGDIDSVAVKFYRTTMTSACTADPNNCYGPITPVQNTCVGNVATYTATIPVYYYAEPTDAGTYVATDWTATVTPTDGGGAGTPSTDTIEMATLTALNVTATMPYSALVAGADTLNGDTITTVVNTGNVDILTRVNSDAATAMVCTFGSIPVGNERYSLTAGVAYGTKTSLTSTIFTIPLSTIVKATSGTPTTRNIYWGIGTPTAVSGSCSGNVVFTAI